ncbi:MAG: NERD domain-containing protein [Clostridia bacterium]|nr:NERD domain-containing protein [Clostridia bacterium]
MNAIKQDVKNQLIATLSAAAPDPEAFYSEQDAIQVMKDFQGALCSDLRTREHIELSNERQLRKYVHQSAEAHGLHNTFLCQRLERRIEKLSKAIGARISGVNGEYCLRNQLKFFNHKSDVYVLRNIELTDEENLRSECDVIIVSRFGFFMLEVKNWNGPVKISQNGMLIGPAPENRYNLPERLSVKEYLIQNVLREDFPENHYHNVLVLPRVDIDAGLTDAYHQMDVVDKALAYPIWNYRHNGNCMSSEQVRRIVKLLQENNTWKGTRLDINFSNIIEDYAELMACAATGTTPETKANPADADGASDAAEAESRASAILRRCGQVVAGAAALTLPLLVRAVHVPRKR